MKRIAFFKKGENCFLEVFTDVDKAGVVNDR